MAKNGMKASTVDARVKALASTFGRESEFYKTAVDYLESRVDEKYIKRAKKDVYDKEGNLIFEKGDITGIRKLKAKEVKDDKFGTVVDLGSATPEETLFGRSNVFNEYIPKVEDIYNRELEAVKEDLAKKDPATLTEDEKKMLTEGPRKVRKDPKIEAYLRGRAEQTVQDLHKYDDTVDDIYSVRDNDEGLMAGVEYYVSSAQSLIDNREKTADWVMAARELINDYIEAVEEERRRMES